MRRTLRLRIEAADGVDHIVEQLDAIRLGRAHRVQVEQASANRVVARVEHLLHIAITGDFQATLFAQQIERLATRYQQRLRADVSGWTQALHQGCYRHDQHATSRGRQAVQGRDALRNDVRMRTEQIVGQRFPIREMQDRQGTVRRPLASSDRGSCGAASGK
jgi:phage FluMu protein gp41